MGIKTCYEASPMVSLRGSLETEQCDHLMRIDLRYGEGYLPTEIENATIVKPEEILGQLTPQGALDRWFESCTFDPTDGESVSVVIDECSSQPPIHDLITRLLSYIQSSPSIEVINVLASKENDVWKYDVLKDPRVVRIRHDASDAKQYEFVGATPTYSTPVHVNADYLKSDYKVGIGLSHLNPITGCTGGPFIMLRNATSERTYLRNERLGATQLADLYAAKSSLRTDAFEVSSLAGLDLVLNVIPSKDGNLDLFQSSDPQSASMSTLENLKSRACVQMTHCADIAVVSQGGYPYDATLHSSIGGLVSGYLATVHGGVIVLIAECSQGPGPLGFLEGVSEFETEEEVRVAAEGQYAHGMDVARLFLRVVSSRRVILCSRLRESLVAERLRCTAVRDPDEGLESAQTMVTSKSRIVIIPEGNSTIPMAPK